MATLPPAFNPVAFIETCILASRVAPAPAPSQIKDSVVTFVLREAIIARSIILGMD